LTGPEGRIDPEIVASIYQEYANELRAFLIGVLRNGELAAEVLQSTFAKAVEAGHTARSDKLKGWLFKVALNEARLLRRRSRIHAKSLEAVAWSKTRTSEIPEESVVRQELIDQVRKALSRLPETQREVVRLRIYDEKTFAVIAEELQLPLGTVLTRMRLALQKLRSFLNDDVE
jgi:RNA polymerase sigma-70 factor (ECF subfamily)